MHKVQLIARHTELQGREQRTIFIMVISVRTKVLSVRCHHSMVNKQPVVWPISFIISFRRIGARVARVRPSAARAEHSASRAGQAVGYPQRELLSAPNRPVLIMVCCRRPPPHKPPHEPTAKTVSVCHRTPPPKKNRELNLKMSCRVGPHRHQTT